MEQNKQHPLDCILNQSGLSMLECLIPFVDYPLKLPLALFIKFHEIQLIVNALQSPESIRRFGLHEPGSSPMDMVCALTGMSKDMLNMLLSMSSMDLSGMSPDLFSSLSGMGQNAFQGQNNQNNDTGYDSKYNTGYDTEYNNGYNTGHNTGNLDDNISNIFAEYDLEQAENYARQ